ncbi:hypothetical protein RCL1_001579 [Eukaryota sp. TZLM3-RCL]
MTTVSSVYLLENYKRTYEGGITALENIIGERFEDGIRLQPPLKKRGIGRPKTRRIRMFKKRGHKFQDEWKDVYTYLAEHFENMKEDDSESEVDEAISSSDDSEYE